MGNLTVTNQVGGGNPGGCLQASYTPPPPGNPSPPPVGPDALVATGLSSTANFVGNYSDVEAFLLGFDFYAANFVPTNTNKTYYRVNLISGTNYFQHRFDDRITSTGVWHRVRTSLMSPELGKWTQVNGGFSSLITNVTRVEISIELTQVDSNEAYRVDNIFLDRLPAAVALSMVTSGVDVTWLHMRTGDTYRFEAAKDLVQGDWEVVSNVTAIGGEQVLSHGATNAFQGYRVVIP